MAEFATLADKRAIEAERPLERCWTARTLYEQLCETAARFPERPAVTFQLRSEPGSRAVTLTWAALRTEVTRAANLLRKLGLGPCDTVAYLLPNGIEAAVALLAGATAGVVTPINPTLPPQQVATLLRESGAKVVVTLAPVARSALSEQVAAAVAAAPGVETVLEVDLGRYLSPPLRWIAPLARPRRRTRHRARVLRWEAELARMRSAALDFDETRDDRVCARFHSGGTTGRPKLARHRASGMLYNGWCGAALIFTHEDVLLCPLPMFHVFAAYPVFMSCLMSGAEMVMITPQGYRGAGVFDNFWRLVERHRVSFVITVPTAVAALMHRPVDADVSTLRLAISGSAPMPAEIFRRFEAATGVQVLEGYGLTEATCLVSINPPDGERRIGSVGLPFPHTEVRILPREGAPGEIGEICVRGPGVHPGDACADPGRNQQLFTADGFLRTGDLGRIDGDGYLWITGRAKDMIIRGGHNIDPALVEEAMLRHPAVELACAVGQPDAYAGEVPAVYVELCPGAAATAEALMAHARAEIGERAAVPRHIEILSELPRTQVGKVFKPELRRRAIARVYGAALAEAGLAATVAGVAEDSRRGLVAVLAPGPEATADEPEATADEPVATADEPVAAVLGRFVIPWQWRRNSRDTDVGGE